MKTRKKIEEILLTDYGFYDEFTIEKLLELFETNEKVEKLQAFKDYVHQRLDDAGIEKEPKGEHSQHGCRIGDRLDIVLNVGNITKETVKL